MREKNKMVGRRKSSDSHTVSQVTEVQTTVEWVMSKPAFRMGVEDVRRRRPYRAGYDSWDINTQWGYERGRAWAILAPHDLPLHNTDGTLNATAIRFFQKCGETIR